MKSRGRIFLLDDDKLIVSMLSRSLKKAGFETQVHSSAVGIIPVIAEWQPDLVLLDIHLDEGINGIDILQEIRKENIDTAVIMLTADDTAESAIRAMKLGAADYLTKPFNVEEVKMVIDGILEKVRLKEEVEYLRKSGECTVECEIISESAAMQKIKETAAKLAEAHAPGFLITGESGTGKEVMARYIHNTVNLSQGNEPGYVPFISVNCTALPDNLIESELFGHTKHAFTDAKSDKKGMFELANGGTILLDEIGDMRIDLQSKLLRVLEERTVRRLGGKVDIPLDITVIATTNKDLNTAVANKEFREDLFYRLSTFHLHIPPLRERRADILPLARHFINIFSSKYYKKNIKGLTEEAEKALCTYNWPGNVRELRNILERCVVLENMESLTMEYMPVAMTGRPIKERRNSHYLVLPDNGISLEEVEKDLIRQALEMAENNQTRAAKLLDITYDTLRYQVKKYGLV
ncbi:MAG: sigma-54 dependent transcriptional regulator [Desulfobulbaceae bacterium]|nr:sigma-54 dependent transcriptional regulator [Desulfobulbaceae bacterium]